MLKSSGLFVAFAAVFLQIAVFLQPLLPVQYQIAPVCESVSALVLHSFHLSTSQQSIHSNGHHHAKQGVSLQAEQTEQSSHNHHDPNHQCQYCNVYGNLVMPTDFGIDTVLIKIQVRLLAYVQAYKHVYFELQQLYLMPQGRAPPSFITIH